MKTPLAIAAFALLGATLGAAEVRVSANVSIGDTDRDPKGPATTQAPGPGKGPPPWAPAHGRRAKFSYQYYPDFQVYRRASDGVWFYFSDGKWQAGARLPAGIQIDVKNFVTLDMDSDSPFSFHDAVKAAYPGKSNAAPAGTKVAAAAKVSAKSAPGNSGRGSAPGRGRGRGNR